MGSSKLLEYPKKLLEYNYFLVCFNHSTLWGKFSNRLCAIGWYSTESMTSVGLIKGGITIYLKTLI